MGKWKLNARGVSITELLAGVAILGITVMGSLSMQKMNLDMQKQTRLVATAQELNARMKSLLLDSKSWANTISAASNHTSSGMGCLANKTSCTGAGGVFNIYDGGAAPGTVALRSLATATSNGAAPIGFTEAGAPCTVGFNYSTGTDACPFALYIRWAPVCPGGTCINPQVTIDVDLIYRPTGAGTGTESRINTSKYSLINFKRGATALSKTFFYVDSPDTTSPFDTGGGACSGTISRSLTERDDSFNIATPSGAGFVLTEIGTYKCTISATAFGVDTYKVSLKQGSTILGSSSGIAPQWLQSNASFDVTFTATSLSPVYTLEQVCQNGTAAGAYALGLPASPYTVAENIFASVICTQVYSE